MGGEDSTGNWIRDHSCYFLAENLSTFCWCPEILWETKFKGNGLYLLEKISRQHGIQAVHGYCWLLWPKFIVRITVSEN